jgi:hypothetical protein
VKLKAALVDVLAFLKRAAIPLIAVAIVAFVPSVRDWLTAHFQSHPLWGAAVLAMLCFATAYLLAINRNGTNDAQPAVFQDTAVIFAVVLVLLTAGFLLMSASTILAIADLKTSALRTSSLWASAWFMAGFLAGFLFGVPKVVGDATPVAPAGGSVAGSQARAFAQRPNTNLEQISDWLTKIIVGLGLVELRSMPGHLKQAATWVAQTLTTNGVPTGTVVSFAGSLIVYFAIIGFLAGYLLTLLFLAGAFGRAGQQAYGIPAAFASDNLSDRIRNFWRPNNGPPDPTNSQKLTDWINKNLPAGKSITDLINTQDLDWARQKVIADLAIP